MTLPRNTPAQAFVTPDRKPIDSRTRCHGFILAPRKLADGSNDPDLRCRKPRGENPVSNETSLSVNKRWYCHVHQWQRAAEDCRATSEGPEEDFDSPWSFKRSNSADMAMSRGEEKPLKEENSISPEPLAETLQVYTPTRGYSGNELLYSIPLWGPAEAIRRDSSKLKPHSSLPRCLPTEIKSEFAQEEPERSETEVRRNLGPEFRKVRAVPTFGTTILEPHPQPGSVQSSPRATTTSANKLPSTPILQRSSVIEVSALPGSMVTIAKNPVDKSRQNRGYRSLFSFFSCCLTGEESEDEKEVSETGLERAQHPRRRGVTSPTNERRTTEGCQSIKKEPYSLPDKALTKIQKHFSGFWSDNKWIKCRDNMGYIYVYEFTGYLKDAPTEKRNSQDCAYLKLQKAADGKHGGSNRGRYEFLTDQRDKDSRVVKIGRSCNVAQRLGQWTSGCCHDTSRNDQFPPAKGEPVPFIRLIEHYIHVELDEYRRWIRCKYCPRTHKELFQLASEEIPIVSMIINRWVNWAFARQKALALGHLAQPPLPV